MSISNFIITQIPEYEVYHTITHFEKVYPILFLHGNSGNLHYWVQTTEGYKEALMKIAEEHYRNYEALECNLHIYPHTQIPNTYLRSYPKRQIYNAQYYLNAPINRDNIHGAIGSNGNVIPLSQSNAEKYNNVISYGTYAQRVAEIVNRILDATYSDKILVVAHSMGGLVIRSAIKYYGLQDKVERLLTIGTPHNGVTWQVSGGVIGDLLIFFLSLMLKMHLQDISVEDYPNWMLNGEIQEMGFILNGVRLTWDWKSGSETGTWTYFLNQGNWNNWTRIATIAGDLNPVKPVEIYIPIPFAHTIRFLNFQTSDGLVSTNDVNLPFAIFNSVYHGAHGTSGGSGMDLGWLEIGKIPT